MSGTTDDKKEACKTYVEQTKLLVALASGFILSPGILIAFVRNDKKVQVLRPLEIRLLFVSESLFVLSIFSAYLTIAALVGEQDAGTFNVYRKAIRVFSILQLICYLLGIVIFGWLVIIWSGAM